MSQTPSEEIDALLNQMAKQNKAFAFIKSPEGLSDFITLIPKTSRPVFFEHFNNERILAIVGDIHKLAAISRNIDVLIDTINKLPPAMQEGELGLHSIKELEVTELRALYDGILSPFEKYLSDEKMTQLVESYDAKQLVTMAIQYNISFFIIAKYVPDANFTTFMNAVVTAAPTRYGVSFIDSLSEFPDLDKELSKLPREKSQLLADRLFATARTEILTSETNKYDQLLNQIGKHLSPEATEIHKDLIVRNRASEEMIKHVFIFKQTLIDQRKYLLGKRDNKDHNPKTVHNELGVVSDKNTSIYKKSNIIDEIVKRIDTFIIRPETSEYKRLAKDMKENTFQKWEKSQKLDSFRKGPAKHPVLKLNY